MRETFRVSQLVYLPGIALLGSLALVRFSNILFHDSVLALRLSFAVFTVIFLAYLIRPRFLERHQNLLFANERWFSSWSFYLVVASLSLPLMANRFFHAVSWGTVFLPTVSASALLIVVFFSLNDQSYVNRGFPSERHRIPRAVLITVLICLSSLGWIIATNGIFDHGDSASYRSRLIKKQRTRGNTAYFYVRAAAFGPAVDHSVDIRVSRDQYNNLTVGDEVEILVKPGRWGFPWVASVKEAKPVTK